MKKIFLTHFCVLLLLLSGCSQKIEKRSFSKGTIVLSTSSDPKSFNPIIAKETSTTLITGFIFEGLVRINGITLEVEPCLAEKWEHDKSGKIWKFYLRKGVKWQDGEEFTADDVVFTFNSLIYNKEIPTSSRDIFTIDGKKIKVRKINEYTVEFQLPEKFAPFLRLMTQEILPKHKLIDKVKKGIFNSSWGVNENVENIVGTGPFKLKEYRPGEWIILDKNPLYWKKDKEGRKLPYIERIVFLIVADPNMAILKFRAGEIDVISIRGQDYPVLKPLEKKKNFKIYKLGPSLGSEFLTFNQSLSAPIPKYKIKWFRNLNFRKAIAHCIDKKSIIKNVYGGFGISQDGPMNISSGFFYNKNIKRYKYNLEKAKELLKKENFYWKNSQLYDKDSHPVEFTILTNSNNFERIQIGNIIQDDLTKIGMKVNLLPVEFNTLVSKLSVSKEWEAVIIGLTGGIEPHGGKNVWMSNGQLHLWNLYPGNQITEWEKELNEIFEKGAKELNPEKRKKLYDRWQEIVAEKLPVIYTVNPVVMYAIKNKFGNIHPTVYGGVFHNIEEIYIKNE
ncbi:ABC transporter substrate-binding protein [bacterium]|nr:ABC transporter substrate-binding protein [bacterium]